MVSYSAEEVDQLQASEATWSDYAKLNSAYARFGVKHGGPIVTFVPSKIKAFSLRLKYASAIEEGFDGLACLLDVPHEAMKSKFPNLTSPVKGSIPQKMEYFFSKGPLDTVTVLDEDADAVPGFQNVLCLIPSKLLERGDASKWKTPGISEGHVEYLNQFLQYAKVWSVCQHT